MLQVNLEEAKGRLLELIDAVLKGETVLIIKDLQEAVQLVPAVPVARRQFGSAKGLIVMADNFDAPLPDFNAYMP
ncbi:MAG: type II toxin-antitoxin system Phd/YefM family antitoxin [Anaerolineales bacterium]